MWKNGYPCRCRECGARKTLRHRPESYFGANARHARCPMGCGPTLRVDAYRRSREHKRVTCWCDNYHFPHRRGSLHCADGAAGREGFPFFANHTADFAEWADRHYGIAPASPLLELAA
jgi:hypothetical protein